MSGEADETQHFRHHGGPHRLPEHKRRDGRGGQVKEVANGKLARTIPFRVSADETFDIGEDTGTLGG
jgi:hypothetical protein